MGDTSTDLNVCSSCGAVLHIYFPHGNMAADILHQPPSLFQDLKLKRKRVNDLLTDPDCAHSLSMESCEVDRQSDISNSDSAYVSNYSSEYGGSDEVLAESKTGECKSPTVSRERGLWPFGGKEGLDSGATMLFPNSAPGGAAYMHGYVMHLPAGFPTVASDGVRLVPVVSLPTHGMYPSSLPNLPAPMFFAAPPGGYFLGGAETENMSVPVRPVLTVPAPDNLAQSTAITAGSRQNPPKETNVAPPASSSVQVKPQTIDENRLEKDEEFITHYTLGKFAYTGHLVENPHNKSRLMPSSAEAAQEDSDGEEALVCAICCDRATGLHYGIITCEGWVASCGVRFFLMCHQHPSLSVCLYVSLPSLFDLSVCENWK